MSEGAESRTNRLRDLLGAAVVAVGICFTLTSHAKAEATSPPAPLAERLRQANDSLSRLIPDAEASGSEAARGLLPPKDHATNLQWRNWWMNFNPWRNWNNWPNWHNFNQWGNF